MSFLNPDIAWPVLRSTVFLSIAAVTAMAALRILKTRSPRTAALAWSMVLISGLMVVPTQVEIPWYEPKVEHRTFSNSGMPAVQTLPIAHSGNVNVASAEAALHTVATETRPVLAPTKMSWQSIGLSFWLSGLLAIAVATVCGYIRLLISLTECWKPQRLWKRQYQHASQEVGVADPPRMIVHSHLGPFLCLTPRGYCLVIPADQWAQLSGGERDVILRHELAHYLRGDVWRWIPLRLIVLLHWFNPLAWLAVRRIEEVAEWEADRIALHDNICGVGHLANALLKLAQTKSRSRLLAPAASGRSLKRRLENLIYNTGTKGSEPMLKRLMTLVLLAAVLIAGAVQVRLVAQEDDNEFEDVQSRVSVSQAVAFAEKLRGDDDLTNRLKAALPSETGALVLRDVAGYYEEIAQDRRRAELFDSIFSKYFKQGSDGWDLKTGQEGFRTEFLQAAQAFNDDLTEVHKTLHALAKQIDPETELDRLLHRFLTNDRASTILYAEELRRTMRPGDQLLEEVFDDIFALNRNGRYEIRADSMAKAEQMVRGFSGREQLLDALGRDLVDIATEVAEVDDLHRSLKEALKDPQFAILVGLELFEEGNAGRQNVEDLVNEIDDAFHDVADGMVLWEEARSDIEEYLEMRLYVKSGSESLRAPMLAFAQKVADHDEVHQLWKELLKSEFALVYVSAELDYASADLNDTVRMYTDSVLEKKDNGRLKAVAPEGDEEGFSWELSDMFRMARQNKRKGRELRERAAQINDADLRQALLSAGGEIAFADHMERQLATEQTDGLADWIAEHFETVGDGYTIREEQKESIEGFLKQITEVTEELQNADF